MFGFEVVGGSMYLRSWILVFRVLEGVGGLVGVSS